MRNVERRLVERAPAFPAGLSYKLLESQAGYIVDSIKGVRNTALEALALVVLVLFVFLDLLEFEGQATFSGGRLAAWGHAAPPSLASLRKTRESEEGVRDEP